MKKIRTAITAFLAISMIGLNLHAQEIPLPEHPRPDFQRENWVNLNGTWEFQFDSLDVGLEQEWFKSPIFVEKITVPFPWGSRLSGVDNLAHIGWYSRRLDIPVDWSDKRTFLIVGA